MELVDYFRLMDRYNRWQNGQMFEVCQQLSRSDLNRDQGAFFNSIHGTLNHILVADKIWMSRLDGTPFQFVSLDQELHADFRALHDDRVETDQSISRFVRSLQNISGNLNYTDSFGSERSLPMHQALGHLFNHSTHHRGQVTTLLFQQGVDMGITDLARMPADYI